MKSRSSFGNTNINLNEDDTPVVRAVFYQALVCLSWLPPEFEYPKRRDMFQTVIHDRRPNIVRNIRVLFSQMLGLCRNKQSTVLPPQKRNASHFRFSPFIAYVQHKVTLTLQYLTSRFRVRKRYCYR